MEGQRKFRIRASVGKRSMCQIRVPPAYETSPRVPECGGLGRENSPSVALNEGLARNFAEATSSSLWFVVYSLAR